MNNSGNPFDITSMPAAAAPQAARMAFIQKTYSLFLAGIATSIVGGIVSVNTPIAGFVIGMPYAFLGLFALCWVAQLVADDPRFGYPALFGFTFLLGLFVAPALMMVAPGILLEAAFLTCVVFTSLTAYVFLTKQDFSFMGGFLTVATISIMLAIVASFFFQSSGFTYWLSFGVLLISSGWVLYDTSNIMQRYPLNGYCGAALGLFISFWNIFISLVNILDRD